MINKQNIRLIFGLKLKQLRQKKGLSFADLSKASGLSVSYLNEIEKGKKYPKTDKIISLAEALDVNYDQLVSLKLSRRMAPIADLLNSGILESLPLEMFGLEIPTLLDLISDAPTKINAFISTLIKVARNYEMTQENFYFAALRSYQEMNDNYFEELEVAVEEFAAEVGINLDAPFQPEVLEAILTNKYGYHIDRSALDNLPDLATFRAISFPERKRIHINSKLTPMQQCFQLGKELAYCYLALEERPSLSHAFQVHTFEEVLNNFKASYFSVALLMSRKSMIVDLEDFFQKPEWDPNALLHLLTKYRATPEMFLHRMSNLLPKFFGIDNLFFLRFSDDLESDKGNFHITKELHISRLHSPHRNDLNEHYCRRWISIDVLQKLRNTEVSNDEYLVEAQVSSYVTSKHDYLCLTIGRPNSPTPKTNVSVTLGIQVDAGSKKKISWLESQNIPSRRVNETCERCALLDCNDRVAEPIYQQQAMKKESVLHQIEVLKQNFES